MLALVGIALVLAVRLNRIRAGLTDPAAAFLSNPADQADLLLENFPVYEQAYANSCGPTTISMVYSYLVEPISEQELADQLDLALGQSGMLPAQFSDRLQSALGGHGYRVEHQVNSTDAAFLEQTYRQLEHGIPVPIYFSTLNAWDKPNYDTHYSVITGMRPQKHEVIIANAYGFVEEMPISDLLAALKYNNFHNAPIVFRLGLFTGVINLNNLFIIQK